MSPRLIYNFKNFQKTNKNMIFNFQKCSKKLLKKINYVKKMSIYYKILNKIFRMNKIKIKIQIYQ